jgi:hypothetical protein
MRYDPPRTPGGYLVPDSWHRGDVEANEDLDKIIAARRKREARAAKKAKQAKKAQ